MSVNIDTDHNASINKCNSCRDILSWETSRYLNATQKALMKPSRPAAASAPNGPRLQHRPFSDPNRLAPEDAFSHSPPKKQSELGAPNGQLSNGVLHELTRKSQRKPEKERGRSGSRRRRQEWKKLLWVPQIGCKCDKSHIAYPAHCFYRP